MSARNREFFKAAGERCGSALTADSAPAETTDCRAILDVRIRLPTTDGRRGGELAGHCSERLDRRL
ncbi:hypothetical protein J6590_021565 [Homalodisca vitripennis]|nr:hypothetical protein J6590_021565 [Homalodisca vitripennis]